MKTCLWARLHNGWTVGVTMTSFSYGVLALVLTRGQLIHLCGYLSLNLLLLLFSLLFALPGWRTLNRSHKRNNRGMNIEKVLQGEQININIDQPVALIRAELNLSFSPVEEELPSAACPHESSSLSTAFSLSSDVWFLQAHKSPCLKRNGIKSLGQYHKKFVTLTSVK